jgi:hypothetical protein
VVGGLAHCREVRAPHVNTAGLDKVCVPQWMPQMKQAATPVAHTSQGTLVTPFAACTLRTHMPKACRVTRVVQGQGIIYPAHNLHDMLRSYHSEQTRSHQNSEVNLSWAASVLGTEMTWEPAVS